MLVAEHLGQVGEDLVEHVVATARAQGVSWSEIGAQMGISKQAAHQRLAKSVLGICKQGSVGVGVRLPRLVYHAARLYAVLAERQ